MCPLIAKLRAKFSIPGDGRGSALSGRPVRNLFAGRPEKIAFMVSAKGPLLLFMSVVISVAVSRGAHGQETATYSGTWTATVGESRTLRGRWIGQMIPGETFAAHGSWTLTNAAGKTAMSGTWSAKKSPRGWQGTWSAQVEKGGAAAGTWKADLAADPKATLQTMLELVAKEEIGGTWRGGRLAGSWWLKGKQSIAVH